jgi:hypothetical protein
MDICLLSNRTLWIRCFISFPLIQLFVLFSYKNVFRNGLFLTFFVDSSKIYFPILFKVQPKSKKRPEKPFSFFRLQMVPFNGYKNLQTDMDRQASRHTLQLKLTSTLEINPCSHLLLHLFPFLLPKFHGQAKKEKNIVLRPIYTLEKYF